MLLINYEHGDGGTLGEFPSHAPSRNLWHFDAASVSIIKLISWTIITVYQKDHNMARTDGNFHTLIASFRLNTHEFPTMVTRMT